MLRGLLRRCWPRSLKVDGETGVYKMYMYGIGRRWDGRSPLGYFALPWDGDGHRWILLQEFHGTALKSRVVYDGPIEIKTGA